MKYPGTIQIMTQPLKVNSKTKFALESIGNPAVAFRILVNGARGEISQLADNETQARELIEAYLKSKEPVKKWVSPFKRNSPKDYTSKIYF